MYQNAKEIKVKGLNVAIVDDIRKDARTKNVLAQTNTKTVSAPPSSTGLTGDQLPAEIFTVDDFDLVKNQVHLEEKNFQLLEALNTMGQISNMQSQSGPIPGTQFVSTVTDTTGSGTLTGTCYQPEAGTVWQLCAAELTLKNATNVRLRIGTLLNSSKVQISLISSAGIFELNEPIFIGYPCVLEYQIVGSSGDNTIAFSLVRVR